MVALDSCTESKSLLSSDHKEEHSCSNFHEHPLCFIHEQHIVVDEAEQSSEINEKFATDACPG